MENKIKLISTMILVLFLLTGTAFASGMRDKQDCLEECGQDFTECEKTEDADTAMNITCKELLDMCTDRCKNISTYISCKDQCGNDQNCLKKCKGSFVDEAEDYQPYLENRSN